VKKPLLAGVAVSLLPVGILVSLTSPRPCPVTKQADDRIRLGDDPDGGFPNCPCSYAPGCIKYLIE
jgi:hypothetical protein